MATNWKTIHIFGGDDPIIQIIGENSNTKYSCSLFTKIAPFITELWTNRPDDFYGGEEYRVITIIKDIQAEWMSKRSIASPSTNRDVIKFRKNLFWFNQNIYNDLVEEVNNINS